MAKSKDDRPRKETDGGLGEFLGDLLGPSISGPTFKGYQVVSELGAGGMGQVWRARDLALGREVAVKTIKPDLTPVPNMKERFLREVRALARVKSDHVVAVHHVGETRDAPFVVMELLHGESLQARLKRLQRLPIADVISIGVQACAGLEAIHREGLVHRDVKPSNLWLEDRGEGQFRVKVLDFGLVRSTDSEGDSLTNSGAFLGTPAYMSPEQAAGLPVEPASDLFSLGCVLYQALCGQRPFAMNSPFLPEKSMSSWEFVSIEKQRPDAPPELVKIIARMLSRDPKKRPKSAKSVGEQLAAMADGAKPKPRSSNRLWAVAFATVVVALLAAFLWPRKERNDLSFVPPLDQKREVADPRDVNVQSAALTTEVPDWAKNRKIVRVASNGAGDFISIQAALDKIQSGEAIELLGETPYREWLQNKREIEDIGLFSKTGAVVETPRWEQNEGDAKAVDGPFLGAKKGFRLSGIEFRLPPTPEGNPATLHGMNLFATGELVVENCVFWQPSRREEVTKSSPFVMGFSVHITREGPVDIRIVGNLFRCGVGVMDWEHNKRPSPVRALIERNLIVSAKDAIWIPFTQGEYTVKENLIWALENGVGLVDRDQTSKAFALNMHNNTIVANHFLYAGEQSSDSVGKAEFTGNVVVNRMELGISSNEKDGTELEKQWKRSKNWYALEPAGHDSLPLTGDEQIGPKMLESDDWTNPLFGRLRSDSEAVNGGLGGKQASYAGALSSDSNRTDEWAAKWRKHPAMKGW